MFRLFGKDQQGVRKKSHTRRQVDVAEQKRRRDFKQESEERAELHKEYMNMLKDNPKAKKDMVAKTFGIDISEPDPVAEMDKELDKLAIEKIQADPEMKERLAEAKLKSLEEKYSQVSDFGDGNYADDPIAQYIETTERLKEIKELGGGGGGILGTILNSEMAKEMGPVLLALFTGKLPQLQAQLEAQQMGEAQQLAQLQTAPPVAEPETKTEPTRGPPEKLPEAPPEAPTGLDLEMWVPYLDDIPENFVEELNRLANGGNEQAIFVLEVLRTKEVDEILEMLQPLKEQEEYREIIVRLKDQEWWLTAVIELVRAEEPLNLDVGDG